MAAGRSGRSGLASPLATPLAETGVGTGTGAHADAGKSADSAVVGSGAGADGLVLSFDRADFLAATFSTTGFVAARKHLPVDQFKHDLHAALRVLKNELVELINNDYAQFISLSTNLVGVDHMIADLKKPLSNIRSSVEGVRDTLNGIIERLEFGLERRALIRTKKTALEVFISIHESLEKVQAVLDSSSTVGSVGELAMDEKLIERVAIEYNQLQYLVSRGESLAFVSNIAWRIEGIKNTLVSTLSGFVRQACSTISADPSNNDAASSLLQSLRVFVLIDRVPDAFSVFEDCILSPFVDKVRPSKALLLLPTLHRILNHVVQVYPCRND
nr:Conserved oligomeric Golgi complex subunit 2 [Polyrhizophydium stewartii]